MHPPRERDSRKMERGYEGKSGGWIFLTGNLLARISIRTRALESNIINIRDWLVITIIKFPRGSRRALSADIYAASSPLSLPAMVPDTDLQLLLIESNTGRVFRTLNEWRIGDERSFPRLSRALDACDRTSDFDSFSKLGLNRLTLVDLNCNVQISNVWETFVPEITIYLES